MAVTATYNNGITEAVTGYTVSDGSDLTKGQTSVIISYTYNGVIKTITQAITVVLKGDVNGDNKIDFRDILLVNNYRLGKEKLKGIYLEAADVKEDGVVNFRDILQINKYRLGILNSL